LLGKCVHSLVEYKKAYHASPIIIPLSSANATEQATTVVIAGSKVEVATAPNCEASVFVAEADTLVDTSLIPFSVALASDAETSKLPGGGTTVSFVVPVSLIALNMPGAAIPVPVWGALTLDAILEAPNLSPFTISTIFDAVLPNFVGARPIRLSSRP
jgi:hypothetical protein